MSDFDLCQCSCCDRKLMRTNFSLCSSCNEYACAFTDKNCGIRCPITDSFVCGGCLREHAKRVWENSNTGDIVITKKPVFAGIEYTFEDQEPLKIKGVSAFTADGVCRVVIENVETAKHSK